MDANGNPIEFIIGDGTTHDVKVAPDLIDCLDFKQKYYVQLKAMIQNHSEKKSRILKLKRIFLRNLILNPVMNIWIGIYIKLDT